MSGIDEAALRAAADWESEPISILEPGEDTRALIPQAWWPVSESADPQDRAHAALALWNTDFLELIPRYAAVLHNSLVDVRVAKHTWLAAPSLDYVVRRFDGDLVVWVGEDPRTIGDEMPPLFDSVPPAVQAFLRQVHAGYTIYDGESCGVTSPSAMKTLAAYWGEPDRNEIEEWDEDYSFPGSQRLLLVTGSETSHLFTSPDLPVGTAVTYFEPEYEIVPFGKGLDTFMNMPLGG